MADWAAMNQFIDRFRPDWRVHPGELLADVLDDRRMRQSDLARATGYSTQQINHVVKGRSGVSPSMALRLEQALSVPAEFWLHAQVVYDLHACRERVARARR